MFQISNLSLVADFSAEIANNSAVGMLGSFVAAALLIVIPASAFLIFVSQKDSLDRTSTGRR
ncbi:photosystem II reaction center X protein [Prochlorococcus sp. MIT 1314]|uniref:photosystem II reaction center X protein n=1 Tax=Prochlorococcus sp. MIT 1314 TaxID=3096220 RepID=UPI002A747604|nr:photosystem II reaction center X protein [Prochlorococcus sp. MIT 1314]